MQRYKSKRLKECEERKLELEHIINLNVDKEAFIKKYINDEIGMWYLFYSFTADTMRI